MSRKDASFWSEIKSLDERLTRDPDSFCFARLSEVYLKVGLAADALHTARAGVARHPGYLAGQRALAMACHVNGLHEESRALLEKVTAVMPEDVDAQKVYAGLCVQAGDTAEALKAYTTVLDFSPDDVQCRHQLDALQHGERLEPYSSPSVAVVESEDNDEDDEILELQESDIVEDEEASGSEEEPFPAETAAAVPPHHDPLSTLTLAELYEQQGFTAKALDIYRAILADDPGNEQLREKIAGLEQQEAGEAPAAEEVMPEEAAADEAEEEAGEAEVAVPVESFEPAVEETPVLAAEIAEPCFAATDEAVEEELAVEEAVVEEAAFEPAVGEPAVTVVESAAFETAAFADVPAPPVSEDFAPLACKEADNVVETLDSWLENIRRIKACR